MSIKLRDQVVVITGASSGIGRAAALLFARRGATVVLAARSRESLEEVAVECERLGARAIPVPTDVRFFGEVSDLARRAAMRCGRIDVWVNCAAVMMYERFPEAPMEDFHRVIETNLFGYVHGARAVLPYFHKQGKGTLINIASVVGCAGLAFGSAYSTSKFAILGFSECLQDELRGHPGIHVCTVLPSATDTPIFQHAANYTGRVTQPVGPLSSPEKVARAIVRLADRPKRYTIVGASGYLLLLGHRIAPGLTARAFTAVIERRAFLDQPAPPTAGNLFTPMPQWNRVSGGFRRRQRQLRLFKLMVRGLTLALPKSALRVILRGARERVS